MITISLARILLLAGDFAAGVTHDLLSLLLYEESFVRDEPAREGVDLALNVHFFAINLMSTDAPAILSVCVNCIALGSGPGQAGLEVLRRLLIGILRWRVGCRVVRGLRLLLGLGGFHECLQLLVQLVSLRLLEDIRVSAGASVELHQLLVEPVLLLLMPLLELGRVARRPVLLVLHVALLTAGDSERLA